MMGLELISALLSVHYFILSLLNKPEYYRLTYSGYLHN